MINEDKRRFFRYKCHAGCELKFLNGTYSCTLVDFSDGAGLTIYDIMDFKPGSKVSITASEPEIELIGEIAWVKETKKGLRAGVRRLNNIGGSLRDYPFSAVLFGLQRNALTGVLEIRHGLIVKKVFVDNGNMVFATSSDKADRLGALLLKEGKITLEQYVDSTNELKQRGQRLGKILVEIGAITPKDLFNVVRHQIEEIILNLFMIMDGRFEFFEGPLTSQEVITLRISVANLISRGIKRIDDFEYVEKMCPPLDDVLAVNPSPLNVFQDFDLDLSYKVVLSLVNGKDSLRKILAKSALSDFKTLKVIFTLISMGLIYVEKKEGDAVEIPDSAGIEEEPVTGEYEGKPLEEEPDMTGEEAEPEPEDSIEESNLEVTGPAGETGKADTAGVVSNESFYLQGDEVKTDEDMGIVPVKELSDDPVSREVRDEPETAADEGTEYDDDIDIAEDEETDAEVPDEEPSVADDEARQEDKQADEDVAEPLAAKHLTKRVKKSKIPAILHNLTSGKGKVRSTEAGAGDHSQAAAVRKSPLKKSLIYIVVIIISVAVVILFKTDKILEFFPGEQIMYSRETGAHFPTFHEEALQDLSGIKMNGKQHMPVFHDDAFKILSGGRLNQR